MEWLIYLALIPFALFGVIILGYFAVNILVGIVVLIYVIVVVITESTEWVIEKFKKVQS